MAEDKEKLPFHVEHKYLTIPAIARRAKELAKQHYQTHSIGDSGFDPLDTAIEELHNNRLRVYRRNEVTGELEPYE